MQGRWIRWSKGICGVLLLMIAAPVYAEGEADQPAGPVAILYGEPILLEDIDLSGNPYAEHVMVHDKEGDAERSLRLQMVQRTILKRLQEDFCKEKLCEPTDEEYKAFEAGTQSETPDMGESLRSHLESPDLSEEQREQIEQHLASLAEAEQWKKDHAEEVSKMERETAHGWIAGWKMQKALYENYGGRVIWQQAGFEALGATQAWLEEQQQKGSFEIIDPELEEQFWAYFRMQHPFEVTDEQLKEQGLSSPFEKPWWEMSQDASPHPTGSGGHSGAHY